MQNRLGCRVPFVLDGERVRAGVGRAQVGAGQRGDEVRALQPGGLRVRRGGNGGRRGLGCRGPGRIRLLVRGRFRYRDEVRVGEPAVVAVVDGTTRWPALTARASTAGCPCQAAVVTGRALAGLNPIATSVYGASEVTNWCVIAVETWGPELGVCVSGWRWCGRRRGWRWPGRWSAGSRGGGPAEQLFPAFVVGEGVFDGDTFRGVPVSGS
jgi:hypothetical protein